MLLSTMKLVKFRFSNHDLYCVRVIMQNRNIGEQVRASIDGCFGPTTETTVVFVYWLKLNTILLKFLYVIVSRIRTQMYRQVRYPERRKFVHLVYRIRINLENDQCKKKCFCFQGSAEEHKKKIHRVLIIYNLALIPNHWQMFSNLIKRNIAIVPINVSSLTLIQCLICLR